MQLLSQIEHFTVLSGWCCAKLAKLALSTRPGCCWLIVSTSVCSFIQTVTEDEIKSVADASYTRERHRFGRLPVAKLLYLGSIHRA
jgi:hypothetical protein